MANIFGIIYQIQDDYLNLQSQSYTDNKGFCEDLTEGKFSFPIIHSIRSDTNNKEIINILKQKTTDYTLKKYAVDYMRNSTNSFKYTKNVLKCYCDVARKMIYEIQDQINKTSSKTGNKNQDHKNEKEEGEEERSQVSDLLDILTFMETMS